MSKTLYARLVAYQPNGPRISVLPVPLSFDASIIHNDLGALKITYSRLAAGGEVLRRGLETGLEIGLEVSDGGAWTEPHNCRFLLTGRSRNAEDTSDTVTLNCQAMGWLTNKILNNDASHLVKDGDNKGKRAFLSKDPGTILRTIMDENKARRGAALTLAAGFDTGRDSGGAAWKSVYTLYYSLGTSLNSMIASMVSGGAIDWRTQGRSLLVWNADSASLSRDLSGSVHVSMARGVLEAPEEESIEDLASDILVEGDNGLVFRETNPAAPTPWGGWESYVSQGGVSDQATAKAFMQTTLAGSARVRGQYTRSLLVDDAGSLPLVDYRPGDWITAPTVRHGEKVRVQQITLSLDSGGLKASVTLNDKVYDSQVRQARKIQGITGGATLAGSEGGRPAPEKDHRTPKAPAGLVVATDAYIASNGAALGLATLQWAAVSQATDNTSIDISGYRVEYRKSVAGAPWVAGGVTFADTLTIGIGGLECGVRYEFRVRAVPTYSDRLGDWSPVVVALVASDVTPPSIPSKPILTSKLGVVSVRWDGRNSVGAGMEADFDHCEVGMSASNGNWAYRDRVQGDGYCYVTGLELNSTWWFALRSVDHSGNKSEWGAGASIKVAPAVTQEELNQSAQDILAQAKQDADRQIAETNKKVEANAADIEEARREQEKADAAIKADLKDTQSKVQANTDANTAQQQQIDQTKTTLDRAQQTITAHDKAIEAAQKQADAAKTQADANADLIAANKTEQEKAAAAIRKDLSDTQSKVQSNTEGLTAQQQQITKVQVDLTEASKKIDANADGLTKVQEHQADVDGTVAGNTAAIETNRQNITAAASTAQKALDKANSVGTSLDGLHQIFTGPDDPTTLKGVTVRQGDLWYRTQPHWTTWAGVRNGSASLLADFSTYWTGARNASPSALSPLSSRVVDVMTWDGTRWNQLNLVAANILATGSVTADNMAADSVTAEKIAAGSVAADKIKGNLLSGTTVEGGVFRTLNGRLVINDTGIKLLDANGGTTLTALTADGSVTLKGMLSTGSTVSGATIRGGIVEGAEIHGLTADGSRWLTINPAGMTMGDKLAYDSTAGELTISGTIKASTLIGSTIQSTNGRLTIDDTGITLKDASGKPTLTALTADGGVTMRGSLTSGSTISGTMITGSQFITAGKHVDISDDGMMFTDADGKAILTWAPVRLATAWQGSANASPSMLADFGTKWTGARNASASTLTTLDDRWRLAMDAPIMSSAEISGSTIRGGLIEGAEYRGVKPDGSRWLTINPAGMTMGDKLAYDSAEGQLTLSGTIKASVVTGSTISTTNGRMTWDDTKLVLKDANGVETLRMRTSDGSIALKGDLTSGSTLSGVTVTGSTIQTSAEDKRGVKLTKGGLVGYGADGNAKFTLDTNGNLEMEGGVIANGTLRSVDMNAGTITGTVISGATITGGTISGAEIEGRKANGGTYLRINQDGVYFGDKLSYDAEKNTLSLKNGTLESYAITGGTIKGADIQGVKPDGSRYLRINETGFYFSDKLAYNATADTLSLKNGTLESSSLKGGTITGGTIKGTSIEGGTITSSRFVGAAEDSSFTSSDGSRWLKFGSFSSVLGGNAGRGLQAKSDNSALQLGADYCQVLVGGSSTDTSRLDLNGDYAALVRNQAALQIGSNGLQLRFGDNTHIDMRPGYIGFAIPGNGMAITGSGITGVVKRGTWQGNTTDAGIVLVAHGAGHHPTVILTPGPWENGVDANARLFKPVLWHVDATSFQVRFMRIDTGAWIGKQAVRFQWIAA